jgi:hypothetical protein
MRVLISILCGRERHHWLNPGLVKWMIHDCSFDKPPEMDVEIAFEEDYWPVSHARNVAANRALRMGFDWSIQIDNDEVPPNGLLSALTMAETKKLDVLGIGTYTFVGESRIPISNIPRHDSPEIGAEDDALFEEVERIGGGCLSIHRRVLEKLASPWFRLEIDPASGMTCAEDFRFCSDARKAGFKIWTCRHVMAQHFKTTDLREYSANLRQLSPVEMEKLQRDIMPIAPWAKGQSA